MFNACSQDYPSNGVGVIFQTIQAAGNTAGRFVVTVTQQHTSDFKKHHFSRSNCHPT